MESTIHRSCIRTNTFLGGDRELIMVSGVVTVACDTYISPDKYEDPTSLSFKQIKSVVTRDSTPIMRYGKEYHPD